MLITFEHKEIIGDKYVHIFKMDDDSIKEVETTQEDYEQLATPEHVDPTIEGGAWQSSGSRRKLDTPDGDLHDGECFGEDGRCLAQYNGSIITLDEDELVDGAIEQSILEEKIANF